LYGFILNGQGSDLNPLRHRLRRVPRQRL